MEHAPWKPILFGALASLILLFTVYFFALPKKEIPPKIDRILEFDASSIVGRSEGKKVWEFSATSGWVGKNRDITNLENVKKGSYFQDGEILIKGFTAEKVAASRGSKVTEARKAKALIAITSKKNRKKRKFGRISADYFRYNPETKQSYLSGNIELVDKEITLQSQNMEIDHDKGISKLATNIRINRSDISLNCDNMRYIADEEEIHAQNNVRGIIKGKVKTIIRANSIIMYIDEKKDVTARGKVEAIQGKKAVIAEKAVYNKNKNTINLSGKVETVIEKGRALIKEETAQKLKDKKVKELLRERTLQYSDTLVLSTVNGDYKAYGHIVVKQKGKEAKAKQADYSDEEETITLTGKVSLKEKDRWVKCKKVIVSVKDKTFEAIGKVEAEFKI